MLGRLPDALQKFFGFVGASLTGITALFTATGFLAERARLVMLGLPSTSFDLQQYVETGARFLALLPLYLGTALLLTFADVLGLGIGGLAGPPGSGGAIVLPDPPLPPSAFPTTGGVVAETLHVQTSTRLSPGALGWLVLLLGVGASLFWHYRRTKAPSSGRLQAWMGSARTFTTGFGARHRVLLLLLLLLVQFAGACQQARTIRVHDLLFETPTEQVEGAPALMVSTADLERWVRTGAYAASVRYIGWLILLTLLSGWAVYVVLRDFQHTGARPWEKIWMGASLLLLVSQVTLLPINYGVLLSSSRFPSVCTVYNAGSTAVEHLPPERLALVHETDRGYYLYARAHRRMWFVPHENVSSVVYDGMMNVLGPFPPSSLCP